MNRTMFLTGWVLLVSLLVSGVAWASEISKIEVRGNKRVEADAILVMLSSQVGKLVLAEAVARDVRSIYGLGYFKDVRVEQEQGDKGLVLVYVVQEKPSIIKLAYKGNSEVSVTKIKEVVDIRPLSVLNISKIKKNVEKIKELYVEKGFFLVEVDYELKELPNNYVSVTFVVNEHAKIEIKRISFIGNPNAPAVMATLR